MRPYYVLVGRKALEHAFTVGNGVRAKLEGVLHARLPAFFALSERDRGSGQNGSDDQHKPLHGQASPVTTLRVRV
jgi:hypothetical protein